MPCGSPSTHDTVIIHPNKVFCNWQKRKMQNVKIGLFVIYSHFFRKWTPFQPKISQFCNHFTGSLPGFPSTGSSAMHKSMDGVHLSIDVLFAFYPVYFCESRHLVLKTSTPPGKYPGFVVEYLLIGNPLQRSRERSRR